MILIPGRRGPVLNRDFLLQKTDCGGPVPLTSANPITFPRNRLGQCSYIGTVRVVDSSSPINLLLEYIQLTSRTTDKFYEPKNRDLIFLFSQAVHESLFVSAKQRRDSASLILDHYAEKSKQLLTSFLTTLFHF